MKHNHWLPIVTAKVDFGGMTLDHPNLFNGGVIIKDHIDPNVSSLRGNYDARMSVGAPEIGSRLSHQIETLCGAGIMTRGPTGSSVRYYGHRGPQDHVYRLDLLVEHAR